MKKFFLFFLFLFLVFWFALDFPFQYISLSMLLSFDHSYRIEKGIEIEIALCCYGSYVVLLMKCHKVAREIKDFCL